MLSATMASPLIKTTYPCLMGWYPPSSVLPSTVALFYNAHNGIVVCGVSPIGQLVNDGPLAERGSWKVYIGEVTLVNS